jgi:hypothetical protein
VGWRTNDGGAFGGTYESWIDKQIREAEQRGDFDDLPGKGEPLTNASRPSDPDWWIKQKVAEENLDLSAAMPLPLQLRKEAQGLPDRLLKEGTEGAARAVLDDFNDRVRASWRQSYDGLPVQAQLVDVDRLLAKWRSEQAARTAIDAANPSHTQAPPRPPRLAWRALRQLARRAPWRAQT